MAKFNEKCQTGADVLEHMNDRSDRMERMRVLQQEKREIENNVTEYLIRNDLTEFFTVNWNRVQNTDW
ncbi:MAG: hypothetical protein DRH08_12290 [Deltaproteobacteria bacterium]|nr:MAG: hypothetical protein DRH08_12290 [Deltaproteobacteria bacterium]